MQITKKRAKDKFPAPGFRPGQEDAIEKVCDAINNGYKYILLDAPTSLGKSVINTALLRAADNGYYTTPENKLIDQIMTDEMINQYYQHLKGRNNYRCSNGGETCDDCPSIRNDGWNYAVQGPAGSLYMYNKARTEGLLPNPLTGTEKSVNPDWVDKKTCEYPKQAYEALRAKYLLTNFSYFLLAPHFDLESNINPNPQRDLLVIDEAHDLASHIRENATVTVSDDYLWERIVDPLSSDRTPDRVPQVPDHNTDEAVITEWLEQDLLPWLIQIEEELEELNERTTKQQKIFTRVQSKVRTVNNVLDIAEDGENIVVGEHEYEDWDSGIGIKPLNIADHFEAMVADKADVVLFSSATMFQFKAKELGIKKSQMKKIDLDHNIPSKRRRTHYFPQGKMTYNERMATMPNMVDAIKEIIRNHKGEKGIVHTKSFQLANDIIDRLPNDVQDRVIGYTNSRQDEEQLLIEFEKSDDKVFFSPAHTTGVDLYDSLARYNIIAKVPYPYSGDGTVWGRRLDQNEWDMYNGTAFMELVQASGRTTRSPKDYSVTYILDESFGSLKSSVRRDPELRDHWFFDQLSRYSWKAWKKNTPMPAKTQAT